MDDLRQPDATALPFAELESRTARRPGAGADTPSMAAAPVSAEERLVLALDGFEGPIDLLLSLAREHKLDLTRISILALADQYLAFIERAHALRLELAADYLVMAAWLAFLKSRLLLPDPRTESEDEPSGAEMAEALAFQLRRLEGLQDAAQRLMAQPRLGHGIFARGQPEAPRHEIRDRWQAGLYELLSAYGDIQRRREARVYRVRPPALYSIEAAYERLRDMLGTAPGWTSLSAFLPPVRPRDGAAGEGEGAGTGTGTGESGAEAERLARRSVLAATLVASLELAREGEIDIYQDQPFGEVMLRRARGRARNRASARDGGRRPLDTPAPDTQGEAR